MALLDGKVAVVSASTRGIGRACAELLAKEGAWVHIAARNEERAQELIDQICASGGKASYVRFDAADKSTYKSFVEDTIASAGKLDILVNNYGSTDVSRDHDILNTPFEVMQEIVMDDLRSVWDSTAAAVTSLKEGNTLSIINIASVAATHADLARESYGLAKHAIVRLTQDTALQYARRGVRANTVCPGCIATDAVKKNMTPEFTEAFLKTVPLNRLGEPEDIAHAVLYFASDMSSYVTGQVLEVAGGTGFGTPMYPLYMSMSARG